MYLQVKQVAQERIRETVTDKRETVNSKRAHFLSALLAISPQISWLPLGN